MRNVAHPVLAGYADGASALASGESAISVSRFLSDVSALAAQLPAAGHVVNLCADRYRFAVGFAAALHRGQITLLPASDASALLSGLVLQYDDLYFLHDEKLPPGLTGFAFPASLPEMVPVPLLDIPLEQWAAVLFTSGSTGAPMPNPRRWGALVASTLAAAKALGVDGLAGAHLLGTVPHQHSYGLESVLMLSLQNGFAFHPVRTLLPADIVAQLQAMPAPRLLATTPVHLRSLVAFDGGLPPLHRIVCATAPLSRDLALQAEERFAAPLYEIYGCSEVGQIAVRRTTETLEWTCFEGIELEARGADVWASGQAAANTATLNDVIELTGPGRFILHGRKSDMVNIAGKRSSLSYLNHHLNAIPGVLDGVFVLPESGDGVTRLVAYVVAPGLTQKEIRAALRRHVDPAFLPRPIHFVDALPRNALGKLSRLAAERLALETADR